MASMDAAHDRRPPGPRAALRPAALNGARAWRSAAAALLLGLAAAVHAAEALRWLDGGRPGAAAQQAVDLLDAAGAEGLDPRDYAAAALRQALDRAQQGAPPDAAAAAQIEQGLSAAMERYLNDLHFGRVDPRSVRSDFHVQKRSFDAAAVLRGAVQHGSLAEAAQLAAPRLPVYAELRRMLAEYRGLEDDPAWSRPLPALPGGARGKVEPGQAWAGLPLLARRLAVLGDLAGPAGTPARLDAALADAVRAFQTRHGLAPDGVVGRATVAQLEVPPAARARQIALTMERLRWTPLELGARMIVVNIPEFVLRAYEWRDGRITVQRTMKVIVGRAFDTRTPVFDEPMRSIEFSPYWNIPPSIARAETVPRLRRDPGYWEREGFEFVAGDGRVETALSAPGLDAVLAGQWRIRQRPGPRNALGDIKFVFPNRDNIYLHHTPSVGLFERARRDFSHGCIRVEQPQALATFVLADMPEWTEARIREAMERGKSSTLRLREPVPVLLAYATALVKGGRPVFFDDIYGLDRVLDAALRARAPLQWTMP